MHDNTIRGLRSITSWVVALCAAIALALALLPLQPLATSTAAPTAAAATNGAAAKPGQPGNAGAPAAPGGTRKPTYVSLTFDDGHATHVTAEQILKSNKVKGTFYVVPGWVDTPGYLTKSDLLRFNSDGMEIGGHTVNHIDLTTLEASEARRQVCNDRAILGSWGLSPTNLAYPFNATNPAVEQAASQCGDNTARAAGIPVPTCATCQHSESLPPADPMALKAQASVSASWSLTTMKETVTNAVSSGGGWVMLTFHQVCSAIGTADCPASQSVTPSTFTSFVKWLASYAATSSNNTKVMTVDGVVRAYSGSAYPGYRTPTPVAPPAPAAPGVNAISNPSLETVEPMSGVPACFQTAGWGDRSASWTTVTPGRTGDVAEQVTITNFVSGDAKLMPRLDLGTCSPTVVPGHTYTASVSYQSTAPTQLFVFYRNALGQWTYWLGSPTFPAASDWATASFTTPAIPADAQGLSFGLALAGNGTLTTDDYSLVDQAGATTAQYLTMARAVPRPKPTPTGKTAPWVNDTHVLLNAPAVKPGTRVGVPGWGPKNKE